MNPIADIDKSPSAVCLSVPTAAAFGAVTAGVRITFIVKRHGSVSSEAHAAQYRAMHVKRDRASVARLAETHGLRARATIRVTAVSISAVTASTRS
jgi:hypothetical protein